MQCHWCPGTAAIVDILKIGHFLGFNVPDLGSLENRSIPDSVKQPLGRKQLTDEVRNKIETFLKLLETDGTVLKYSFEPMKIYISDGSLKLDYQYSVRLE
jgi:hypothetical protein